jgi:hypothetical protein
MQEVSGSIPLTSTNVAKFKQEVLKFLSGFTVSQVPIV